MIAPTINHNDLPAFLCHKIVRAIKISQMEQIVYQGDPVVTVTGTIDPKDPFSTGYYRFMMPWAWVERHNPQVGGFYVLYPDGYESYSPQQPFEEGYTRIPPCP